MARYYRGRFPHVRRYYITNGEEFIMSTQDDAEQTIDIMRKYCSQKEHGEKDLGSLSIADAFACLGGNTYSFYVNFKTVVAYEIDETRFEKLKLIVQHYPSEKNKETVSVRRDCLAKDGILDTCHHVVFLDPPWVNPATEQIDNHVFQYASKLCHDIAVNKTAQFVFMKLPLESSYPLDFAELIGRMSTDWVDITTETILRRQRTRPSYTIVCAYHKDTSVNYEATSHVVMERSDVKNLLMQLQMNIDEERVAFSES